MEHIIQEYDRKIFTGRLESVILIILNIGCEAISGLDQSITVVIIYHEVPFILLHFQNMQHWIKVKKQCI